MPIISAFWHVIIELLNPSYSYLVRRDLSIAAGDGFGLQKLQRAHAVNVNEVGLQTLHGFSNLAVYRHAICWPKPPRRHRDNANAFDNLLGVGIGIIVFC